LSKKSAQVTAILGKFFYIDLTDPESGGTGHTKQVCRMNGVPFVNQKVWFKWLENDGETT